MSLAVANADQDMRAKDQWAISVKEAAGLLGVSRTFLYERWKKGLGPPRVKLGARVLVPVDTLQDWLKSQSQL